MKKMENTIRHRRNLWKLLSGIPGDAVEIGVAEGNFSAELLACPRGFPRVYMVDRWQCTPEVLGDSSLSQEWHDANWKRAIAQTKKYGSRAVFLQGESVEMAKLVPDQSLALVYIDGDHSFDGVKADIEAWVPKVVPGGIMAFHDFLAPEYGVNVAVCSYCVENGRNVFLLLEDNPQDAGAYFYVSES